MESERAYQITTNDGNLFTGFYVREIRINDKRWFEFRDMFTAQSIKLNPSYIVSLIELNYQEQPLTQEDF